MAKLYPPILENSIPAFYGAGTITVPFSLNRTVGYGDITGFAIIVKSTVTNEIIYSDTTNTVTTGYAKFSIPSSSLEQGGFYKVQLAFIDSSETVGYYSNVSIVKYIGVEAPTLTIQDETATDDCFIGTYTCADITEKMYSYTFTLYDGDGTQIDTSGECLHNSSEDVGTTQQDSWRPKTTLDSGSDYTIRFSVTTINGLEVSLSEGITAKKDEEGYCPDGIRLNAELNEENAYIEITISSAIQNDYRNLMYGTFYIYKTSSKDNYESKYKVAYFSLDNQDLYEQKFKDFTVESGYSYQYILQQVNDYGIYSEEVYSNKIDVYYEHLYLFDGIKQLKIEFNPKVSTFKDTILESKQDTIGGQYPFIFRNKNVRYKEMSISGLISYQMDEENLFANDYEIWSTVEESLDGTYTSDKSGWTHNLTDNSRTAERAFKLMVLDWLNDGTVKLFKSPVEGNYIVRLMNVSLSPQDSLGRMLHTFTATAYEVDDLENVDFCEAISVSNSGKYIGYRTIPLYKFPETKIVGLAGGNYYAIDNNTLYEIIGTPALEYVRGVRFEDIKPGTKFKMILERGLEKVTITIRIGATGFYRLPRELGYHIKSIKLIESDWNTGDMGFDMINNRGQVTYEFERMAKHNNFNDITAIQSGITVATPWYPAWYQVAVQEAIVDIEGKALYTYDATGSQTAFIEMGYFYTLDGSGEKTLWQSSSDKIDCGTFLEEATEYSPYIDQGAFTDTSSDTTYDAETFTSVDSTGAVVSSESIENPSEQCLLINGLDYISDDDGKYYMLVNGEKTSTQIYPLTTEDTITVNGTSYTLEDLACAYYEEGDSLYRYEKAQSLTCTASNSTDYITSWEWGDQTLYLDKTTTYYYQTYTDTDTYNVTFTVGSNTYSTFSQLNDDGTWTILQTASTADKLTDDYEENYNNQIHYNEITLEASDNPVLFIQSTTTSGSVIVEETVEETPYYKNPFYVTFNRIENDAVVQAGATVYTVSAITTSSSLDGNNTDTSQTTDTIFRNFVPDKNYNQTNVNGDYYIKEEMMNIYGMDFELIQVFYPEVLINKQNFEYTDGTVTYTDVEEDAGYQYTERQIAGVGLNSASEIYLRYAEVNLTASTYKANKYYYYDINKETYVLSTTDNYDSSLTYYGLNEEFDTYSDIVLVGDEMFSDKIMLGATTTEQELLVDYSVLLVDSASTNWAAIKSLYDIPDDIDITTFTSSYYLNLPLYYFSESSIIENGYYYKLLTKKDRYTQVDDEYVNSATGEFFKNDNGYYETIQSNNIYLNVRAQAAQNYTEATTPGDNEILFVYDDSPYHIVKIDLTDRFSYSISAAELGQEDLRNITGVYLGRNVRAFATYKRKLYNYHALIADGVYMDLEAF